MSTVSVGFSRPKNSNILSNAIMKVMGTNYSHSYLVFDVRSTGQKVIYQANRKGVHCLEYGIFQESNVIIDELLVPEDTRTEALRFCIANLGRPYSLYSLFAIYFNIKFGNGSRRFICSELVARALNLDIPNLDTITPKELRDILETKQ